jgi:tRNA threonylcarbamoyladenosine biosynthesis protein TsaE
MLQTQARKKQKLAFIFSSAVFVYPMSIYWVYNSHMKTRRLESTKALGEFAAELMEGLLPREDGQATVLALSGDLGAGKTAFVQTLAAHLGITEQITSPTFVIMKKYEIRDASNERRVEDKLATNSSYPASFSRLIHIDAYRMKEGRELVVLGWEALLSDAGNLIALEWPELVADVVPETAIKLAFSHVDETTRDVHHDHHA